MLRLSKLLLAATAAAAMLAGSPVSAQGLGTRITDAGKKLDQDVQACQPINLGEYQALLHEAAQNKVRAAKMAKKNVPVDQTQIDADLANASALFNRAQAALVGQCMRAAQQVAQPKQGAMNPMQGGQQGTNAAGANTVGASPTGDVAAQFEAAARTRVPTSDDVQHLGTKMVEAYEQGSHGEAGFLRGELDAESARLGKLLKDARQVGDMANINVPETEKRLKQIDDYRKYADSKGIQPSTPIQPRTQQSQPQTPPADAPKQGAMNFDSFNLQMLRAHNQLRGQFGAPPLRLDEVLVQHATERAVEMAKAGDFTHASRAGRGTERENIAKVPTGFGPLEVFQRWAWEQSQFKPGIFPNVCTTGDDCSGVLHLTAILWPDTVAMGCGSAAAAGFTYVVCRLNPGGNKDGKPVGLPVQIASRVEQPTLPNTEVFKNPMPATTANQADSMTVRTASAFDLGIYAGGAWTSDWFDIGSGSDDAEDVTLSWGADLDIVSRYVWRGFELNDQAGLQPNLWVNAYGFTVGTWMEIANQQSDLLDPADDSLIDTKVDRPTLPTAEVFKANQVASATSDKQEPTNPRPCRGSISFWDAEKMYEAAKKAGDVGGMEAAKGYMQAAIGRQWQAMEDSTEAGEMVSVSRYSLGDFLGKMMDGYKEATGGLPPGYYESPNGFTNENPPPDPAAPELPTKEVFNPADAPKCTLDVM